MTHQVEQMFFVGETPWHKLGHYFEVAPKDLDIILPAAGLDWEPIKRPIFDVNGQEINGQYQLVRSDNENHLSIVGARYEPMKHYQSFASLMPLIESGDAEIETAGSLKGGKKIWALLRSGHLKNTTLANGELIRNYFLWSTSHDMSRSNQFGKTSTRVVCANTLAMSDKDSSVKFRHTKSQNKVLDTLVEIATQANMENERMAQAFNFLLSKRCSHVQLEDYITQVLGLTDSTRAKNILNKVSGKAYFGKGNREVKGTWWSALNAVTEHLSHDVGRNAENRYDSLWFGANQGLLNKANVLAIEAAQSA